VCVWVGGFLWMGECILPLTHTYKEKRKVVKSQSKQNIICVQTSYMFRLYIAIIRLNIEP